MTKSEPAWSIYMYLPPIHLPPLFVGSGDEEPAFYHSYEVGDNGWLVGHIRAHKKLFKLFKKYYIKHEVQLY